MEFNDGRDSRLNCESSTDGNEGSSGWYKERLNRQRNTIDRVGEVTAMWTLKAMKAAADLEKGNSWLKEQRKEISDRYKEKVEIESKILDLKRKTSTQQELNEPHQPSSLRGILKKIRRTIPEQPSEQPAMQSVDKTTDQTSEEAPRRRQERNAPRQMSSSRGVEKSAADIQIIDLEPED